MMSNTVTTQTTGSTNQWTEVKRTTTTKVPAKSARAAAATSAPTTTTTKPASAPAAAAAVSTKPTPANSKTVLCKNFVQKGKCPFGKRCTFAHGEAELTRKTSKPTPACWFFNTPEGCSKSDSECIYEHTLVASLRKPLHLQHPCLWYHVRTPAKCKRGKECGGDHSYELNQAEWEHHFPTTVFPGEGYLTRKPISKKEAALQVTGDNFPSLSQTPIVGTKCQMSFLAAAQKPAPKPAPVAQVALAPLPPLASKGGKQWGDYDDDDLQTPSVTGAAATWDAEDDDSKDTSDLITTANINASPATTDVVTVPKVKNPEAKLKELEAQLTKGPVVDGELKEMIVTVLQSLLKQ